MIKAFRRDEIIKAKFHPKRVHSEFNQPSARPRTLIRVTLILAVATIAITWFWPTKGSHASHRARSGVWTSFQEEPSIRQQTATQRETVLPDNGIDIQVQIHSPAFKPKFRTTGSWIALIGTVTAPNPIASVTWSNNEATGTATGTLTWHSGPIPLRYGINEIEVRATDIYNSHRIERVVVDRVSNPGEEAFSDDVRSSMYHGKLVSYSVVDGRAIFEGDIVLGLVEEVETQYKKKSGMQIESGGTQKNQLLWPNGIVPYTIGSTLSSTADVITAINIWNNFSGFTGVTLVPRTNQSNYVNFNRSSECSSFVGMRGGAQDINWGLCGWGGVVHEIGHAVGLWHEQSRTDRDDYVSINWSNIESGKEGNFNQYLLSGIDIGSYDYESIMHYGSTAFSSNGQPTIVPKTAGATIGQRDHLSSRDLTGVKFLYQCAGSGSQVGENTDGVGDQQVFVNAYGRNGGKSQVGCPINTVHRWHNGRIQDFNGGSGGKGGLMKADGLTDAKWIHGGIWNYYEHHGGPNTAFWDGSKLGYPIDDEQRGHNSSISGSETSYSACQNGTISFYGSGQRAGQAYIVRGAILTQWSRACSPLCYEGGPLGMPIGEEIAAPTSPSGTTGRYQDFESGQIYWHGSGPRHNQTFYVQHGIASKYKTLGSGSTLGFPISNEYVSGGVPRNDFEGGHIYWNGSQAIVVFNNSCNSPGQFALSSPANGQSLSSTTTVNLTWGSSANANSYDVYFGTSSNPPFIGNQTVTSRTVTVTPGQTYFWKVVAKVNCGSATATAGVWSFTVQQTCNSPGVFALNSPTNTQSLSSTTSVSLTWGSSANANSYDVYFGTSSNPPFIGNQSGTSRAVTVSPGQTYFWKVVAKVNCGSATATAGVWSFTVQQTCNSPGAFSLTSPSNGQNLSTTTSLNLTWGSSANVNSYDVYFGTTSNPPFVGNQTATSRTVTVTPGQTYFWKVVAKVNCGSATMTAGVWSFTVQQSGCTYRLSSTDNTVSPGTGSTNFQMDTTSGCSWSAVSDSPSWLTTSSSGTGDGRIRYDFASNNSTSSRTGHITAGGQVHTVTQIGLGGGGSVRFSSSAYSVNENGGTITITVTRSGGTHTGTVQYSTSNASATAGSDYTATSGLLLFGPNEMSKSFTVTVLDDTAIEGNESITLTLNNPSLSFTLGTPSSATVNIVDNDTLSAPTANAASNVTSNNFIANWTSSPGAVGYRLDVSTNSSFTTFVSGYQNLDVGNALNRTVSGLTASTSYHYRVRAYNSAGSTSNSNAVTVFTTGPMIFIELGTTNQAAALDSVTWLRGPFRVIDLFNFSSDRHTRVILFTSDLGLTKPDSSQLTVRAGGVALTVENVGPVLGVPGMGASYIVVRLPDGLPAGKLPLLVTLRGLESVNSPTLGISP